jgi:hypothetical protein
LNKNCGSIDISLEAGLDSIYLPKAEVYFRLLYEIALNNSS